LIVNSFPESARYHVPSTIYGSTTGLVYQNFVGSRITTISGCNVSCIPWCPVPEELSATIDGFSAEQYIYDVNDIAHVMLSGYQHYGIRIFNIFSGDTSATTGDRIMTLYNTFVQRKEAARPSRARMRMRSGVSEA
jgi:hypothetical protein